MVNGTVRFNWEWKRPILGGLGVNQDLFSLTMKFQDATLNNMKDSWSWDVDDLG